MFQRKTLWCVHDFRNFNTSVFGQPLKLNVSQAILEQSQAGFNCLRNLTSFFLLEMAFLSRKESEMFF